MGENNTGEQDCDVPGNVQRAAAIFFEYGDFIYTVIQRDIRDENTVEDLFHNFFLSLVSRPIPEGLQDIKGYIYKAILNDITDHIRWLKRYQKISRKCSNYDKIIVNNTPPIDALIDKEQTNMMIELIETRITKNESKAIDLKCREELSLSETADRMNIKIRSVSRYISTGLRKVKQLLATEQEAEE